MITTLKPTAKKLTKKRLNSVAVASLLAMSITPALAAENPTSPWFMYGKLGMAKTDVSKQELIADFSATLTDAQLTSLDDSGVAGGLGLGYQLNQWLSVELGYKDLGEREVNYTGTPLNDAFYPSVSKVYPKSADGMSLSVNAFWPINDEIKVGAKMGVMHWKNDFDTLEGADNVQTYKDKGDDIWFGVEANYQLTSKLQLFATYDHYTLDTQDVDFFGIGARYFFGHQKK
jgi:hypothetical protein